jgi:hypothetical protein
VAKGCGKLSYDAYSKPERRSSIFGGDVFDDDIGADTGFSGDSVAGSGVMTFAVPHAKPIHVEGEYVGELALAASFPFDSRLFQCL